MASARPLAGTRVVITRPAGVGGALARRVRAMGGTPLLLPGSSLRVVVDASTARAALRAALACEVAIFTSPAAVRFSRALGPLRTRATVLAPGAGTARALRRAGLGHAQAPTREDSEGILALPALHGIRGRRIGIIGAPGARGLLGSELAARGAQVLHAHVYLRVPARLDHRHVRALQRHPRRPSYVLLSSAEALGNIVQGLPDAARRGLLAATAVASSERLAAAARDAGFARVIGAGGAHAQALLAAVAADRARPGSLLAFPA